MDKRRGGCAPNIAYTLALLGERPRLMGTAGQDFDEYRQWLESAGVDTSLVKQVPGKFTASFFCSTDRNGNQIASFYTGAMAHAAELSFASAGPCDLTIISPNDPAAMVAYARRVPRHSGFPTSTIRASRWRAWSGESIKAGVVGAHIVICNDYEFEIIREKTGLGEAAMLRARRRPSSSRRARRGRRSCCATGRSTCRPCRPRRSSIRRASATRFEAGS